MMTRFAFVGVVPALMTAAAAGRPPPGRSDAMPDTTTPTAIAMIHYHNFGAVGDGVTDDFDAIIAAHAQANRLGLPVRARDDATYRLGGGRRTAVIQTDTDFGAATFVIDDTQVTLEDRHAPIFLVTSRHASFRPAGVAVLRKDSRNLGILLPVPSLVVLTDANVRRFIRRGLNQDRGDAQTEVILVDRDGTIDPDTPLHWDYATVTDMVAYPVDDSMLTIRGGRFTTVANQAPANYTYFARNLRIERSNVRVEGLEHRVTGEGEHGAPYLGFLYVTRSADVEIRDARLSGHKTYTTIGSAGKPVSMGSYGLSINQSVRVAVIRGRQLNDIRDTRRWGIMASNYSKKLLYDGCELSRFDAHKGLLNGIIRNSTVRDITLTGGGTFTIENSTVLGGSLVSLRPDYGSTWDGDIVIRNSTFAPAARQPGATLALFTGSNDGQHDFGYACHMPRRILIENLRIEDGPAVAGYAGPVLFGDFGAQFRNGLSGGPHPYAQTREVVLRNVSTASGLPLRIAAVPEDFTDALTVDRD